MRNEAKREAGGAVPARATSIALKFIAILTFLCLFFFSAAKTCGEKLKPQHGKPLPTLVGRILLLISHNTLSLYTHAHTRTHFHSSASAWLRIRVLCFPRQPGWDAARIRLSVVSSATVASVYQEARHGGDSSSSYFGVSLLRSPRGCGGLSVCIQAARRRSAGRDFLPERMGSPPCHPSRDRPSVRFVLAASRATHFQASPP